MPRQVRLVRQAYPYAHSMCGITQSDWRKDWLGCLGDWQLGVEADLIKLEHQETEQKAPSSEPVGPDMALNPARRAEVGANADSELRKARTEKGNWKMLASRELLVGKALSSVLRTNDLLNESDRKGLAIGPPGAYVLLESLLNVPAIKNRKHGVVSVPVLLRILESPWERQMHTVKRGRDGRLWVKPKECVVTLE